MPQHVPEQAVWSLRLEVCHMVPPALGTERRLWFSPRFASKLLAENTEVDGELLFEMQR